MSFLHSIRKDWLLIESLINKNSKILDIGCGSGELIQQLEKNINANTRGLEIDGDLSRSAIMKGLNVIQGNAERDLYQYSDSSFDYVILSQTLQAMYNPKNVLFEMLRIGAKAIISFPNFGNWKIRFQLLFGGKMPITEGLPYTWYETPNIHFFTLRDFQEMCEDSKIYIEKSIGLTNSGKQFEISNNSFSANLIIKEAIFLLSKKTFEPVKINTKQKSLVGKTAIVAPR